jgi:hypothetical protein
MEKQWTIIQKELLLESGVSEVIKNIAAIARQNKEANTLMAYYQSNKERMNYQKYVMLGCGHYRSGHRIRTSYSNTGKNEIIGSKMEHEGSTGYSQLKGNQ